MFSVDGVTPASVRKRNPSPSITHCVYCTHEKKTSLSFTILAGRNRVCTPLKPAGRRPVFVRDQYSTDHLDPVMATHPSRARLNARNTKCAPPRQKLKMECSRAATRRGDYVSDVVNYRYPRKMRDLARRFSCVRLDCFVAKTSRESSKNLTFLRKTTLLKQVFPGLRFCVYKKP